MCGSPRRIFDHSPAPCQHGCQLQVDRRAHGYHVQQDIRAVEPSRRLRADDAVFDLHRRSHGGESLDVLVDGTHAAEIAAAGHGYGGLAIAPQHGADQIIGGAQATHHVKGGLRLGDAGAVDVHGVLVDRFDLGTHLPQDIQHHGDVGYLGDVLDPARPAHEQNRRYNGDSGVFRTADGNLTVQRSTALNDVFCHGLALSEIGKCWKLLHFTKCQSNYTLNVPIMQVYILLFPAIL
jgi:hypothetical protein